MDIGIRITKTQQQVMISQVMHTKYFLAPSAAHRPGPSSCFLFHFVPFLVDQTIIRLFSSPRNNTPCTLHPIGPRCKARLLLPKTHRLLDGPRELLVEGVVALVRRQVETVEASVGFRELRFLARLLDREAAGAIGALQVLEAVDRDARCARGELQEARFLLGVPAADDLWVGRVSEVVTRGVWLGLRMFAYLPEVLHDEITLGVAAVVGVFLPVVDVDVRDTTDEEFELALVEDVDEVGGDELMEALDESVELLLHALLDTPLGDQPGKLLAILFVR